MAEAADRVLLASSSPRRLALLRRIGIDPAVMAADVDESGQYDERPHDRVRRLANAKAAAVAAGAQTLIIAADTLVVVEGTALGKPRGRAEAERMLRDLSGRVHQVVTGVAVQGGDEAADDVASTDVRFRDLSDAEIAWYLATREPMDKAGAYGIQGAGELLVDRIDGSYSNVVGLPLAVTLELARSVGWDLLRSTSAVNRKGHP